MYLFTHFSSIFYDKMCREGGELSTRDLQRMVQALPQYSEQIEKLSLHVDVSHLYFQPLILVLLHL